MNPVVILSTPKLRVVRCQPKSLYIKKKSLTTPSGKIKPRSIDSIVPEMTPKNKVANTNLIVLLLLYYSSTVSPSITSTSSNGTKYV